MVFSPRTFFYDPPGKIMDRTLVIGYGNIDRADDGVAHVIINALRRRLGQAELRDDETGLDDLGRMIDSVFLLQLTPELIDVMDRYERLVFVDAHVYEHVETVHCCPVIAEDASLTFTHHMSPAMLLALMAAIVDHHPAGYLVSVRGYDFDFHRGLSEKTECHVETAVDSILAWLEGGSGPPDDND
jgi:hydrogenase maturation protease